MTPSTRAEVERLFAALRTQAESYIAAGHEHASTIFGLMRAADGPTLTVHTVVLAPLLRDEDRDRTAEVLGKLVEPFDAYIYLSENWMIQLAPGEPIPNRPMRLNDPRRVETLLLHFVSKLGDELMRDWYIRRPAGRPPYLEYHYESEHPSEGRCANFYAYTTPRPTGPTQ
jgi:hypothetical protein